MPVRALCWVLSMAGSICHSLHKGQILDLPNQISVVSDMKLENNTKKNEMIQGCNSLIGQEEISLSVKLLSC